MISHSECAEQPYWQRIDAYYPGICRRAGGGRICGDCLGDLLPKPHNDSPLSGSRRLSPGDGRTRGAGGKTMPQTTPELAAEWGDDQKAIRFLITRGYRLTRRWQWKPPRDASGNKVQPTDIEQRAIRYLIEEWDFDGLTE